MYTNPYTHVKKKEGNRSQLIISSPLSKSFQKPNHYLYFLFQEEMGDHYSNSVEVAIGGSLGETLPPLVFLKGAAA